MSQSKPKYTDFDYTAPGRERRGPAAVPNMAVGGLGDDSDPSRDIRAMVDQLEQTARDARAQLHALQAERDELIAKLEQSRSQNEELRARFIEITSIIRERDAALEETERMSRMLTETQARLTSVTRDVTDAQRQRDSLVQQRGELQQQQRDLLAQQSTLNQQREELQRELEVANRNAQESGRKVAEFQKQLQSLREARDAALARHGDVSVKQAALEDEIAELRYELETARAAAAGAVKEEDWNAAVARRDEALARVGQLEQELETARSAAAELERVRQEFESFRGDHGKALAEAEASAAQLRAERDRLAEVGAGHSEESRRLLEALRAENEKTQARAEGIAREAADLRMQLQRSAEQQAEAQRGLDEVSRRMQEVQAQFAQLSQDRSAAVAGREEAVQALAGAQKHIERLIRERDSLRQQHADSVESLEGQLEAVRAQLSICEAANPEAVQFTREFRDLAQRMRIADDERRELAERLDKQREETVDLAAQLRAAQDQVRQMSASLAEARLQTRGSGKRAAVLPPAVITSAPDETVDLPAPVFDGGDQVSAMRHAYQAFVRNPTELERLREIARHAEAYTERARASRIAAVDRLGAAFANLAGELFRYPEQINPAILRTLNEGIEFLATLSKISNLADAKDPAKARILAVDDDVDNCECIRMAMETAMMKTTSSQDPAKALTELANEPYDLIFLDVSMPGINGFELCTQIRSLSVNCSTPVIFLTGLTTAENRVQSSMSGGNDFIGKPFLLGELTVKALILMLKAQFHLA